MWLASAKQRAASEGNGAKCGKADVSLTPRIDWDGIVRAHARLVFAAAWRILGHAADTEDVVQDVFLQAHQVQQAQPIRCWEAFLRRLAVCRALDRLRARRPTAGLEGLSLPSRDDGPEDVAIEHELAFRLRCAIRCLPRREATVFCLRYFDNLSYEEMADTLLISVDAVGTALHKARTRLESLLRESA
jgi:RNA polymerase sigma-70 factor (ECF subfamily)